MCESTVYVRRPGGKEELLAQDVARVVPDGDQVRVLTILGDERRVRGKLADVDLMGHRIVIEEEV